MLGFVQSSMSSRSGSQSGFVQTNNASTNPFGSTSFGGGSPQFGTSTASSVGVSSSPAFGVSSTPSFGSTITPSVNGTINPMFGYQSPFGVTSAPSNFGCAASFGQTAPTFGSTQFGTTSSTFNTQSSSFGIQTPASAFGSSNPFGSSSSLFGGTSTGAFGQPSIPSFGGSFPFGQNANIGSFGLTPSQTSPFKSIVHQTQFAFGSTTSPALSSATSQAFGFSRAPSSGGTINSSSRSQNPFGITATPSNIGSTSLPLNTRSLSFGTQTTTKSVASPSNFGPTPSFSQSTPSFVNTQFGTASTTSNTQSFPFGIPTPSPAFNNPGLVRPTIAVDQKGSRVAKHKPTIIYEDLRGKKLILKLQSISGMPVYGVKSHEELRWVDYQKGDKGGPNSTALPETTSTFPQFPTQSTSNFTPSASKPTTFTPISNSIFNSPSNTPPISSSVQPTPSFNFPPFTTQSTSNLTSPTSTPTVFTPNSSSAFSSPSNTSEPIPSSSSSAQPSPSFSFSSFTTEPISNFTSSTITPAALTPISNSVFSTSSNSSVSFPSTSTYPPLSSSTPSFISSPVLPGSQQTNSSSSKEYEFSNSVPSSIYVQTTIEPCSSTQSHVAVVPEAITNPFGTLPPLVRSSPSVQYGISSMPVAEKPTPNKLSVLSAPRHLSQRRIRLPIRKYNPQSHDGPKVPFFMDDEEMRKLRANSLFIPRENPRSMLTRARTSTEERPVPKDMQHQADENASPAENVYIESLLPKLRHPEYYTEPQIQELAVKEKANPGFCRQVKNFTVGRHGYGYIKFKGETDVRSLDLESIVEFNYREVIVYKDESRKPPVGHGLNKPAEAALLNFKCVNKKTGEQCTQGLKVDKFTEMAMKKTEEQGAEFLSFDAVKRVWKFRVKHFSSYKFEVREY